MDRPSDKHSDRSKTEKVKARLHIFQTILKWSIYFKGAVWIIRGTGTPGFKPKKPEFQPLKKTFVPS